MDKKFNLPEDTFPIIKSNGSEVGEQFAKLFNEAVSKSRLESIEWLAKLKNDGIVAAHPEDGWVDRNKNQIIFVHAYFMNAVIDVGDRVVIGNPKKYRIVRIIEVVDAGPIWNALNPGTKFYNFEEIK